MDRLKHICIKSQYFSIGAALVLYLITWNIDAYIFAYSFLAMGALSICQVAFSIGLIVIDKKDIEFWRRDMQLLAGAIVLLVMHVILLMALEDFQWA